MHTMQGKKSNLKSCCSSESSPRGSSCASSSSDPDVNSTTRLFFFAGALPAPLSLFARAAYLGSWRCLVRRSRTSSSVAVSSPPLSETLRRAGGRMPFAKDPLLLGILMRGWRQGTNWQRRTCKRNHPTTASSQNKVEWKGFRLRVGNALGNQE